MIACAARLALGGAVAWWLAASLAAPAMPRLAACAALAVAAATAWSPAAGLILVAATAQAGLLLAPAPVRAAELLAWSFLAAWLLSVWRPLSRHGWERDVRTPALLYLAVAIASWASLTISGAAGVGPGALPLYLSQTIAHDHFLLSSPEPETWTLLQLACGTGLLLAALTTVRDEPRAARGVPIALIVSMTVLATATAGAVLQQWATRDYGAWFLARYLHDERFALHLDDVNAAGSQYVLAGLAALALAAFDSRRRPLWIAALVLMAPAAWVTGSRSAGVVSLVAGGLAIAAASPVRKIPTRTLLAAFGTCLVLALAAGSIVAARDANVKGSAGRAMRLRSQFTETSLRMFASAPVFGVGIGHYHGQSGAFMPAELRSLYGFENAHNYFAQQFAELGLAGGAAFIWLVAALLSSGWRRVRSSDRADGWSTGLFAGSAAYLLTCVTGHPLLVSEAALPFWIAIGAVAGAAPPPPHTETARARRTPGRRLFAVLIALVVGANLVRGINTYLHQPDKAPIPQGFHPPETDPDGRRFQWTSRHAYTFVETGLGFLSFWVAAPEEPGLLPVTVETYVEGQLADRRTLPAGQWLFAEIPVRRPTTAAYRRVDIRVSPIRTRKQQVGRRLVDDVVGVKVADIRWTPAKLSSSPRRP